MWHIISISWDIMVHLLRILVITNLNSYPICMEYICHTPKPTIRAWRSFHTSSLKAQSGNNTNIHFVTGNYFETKVWLILILIITKQGFELRIIFQVWLGKKISKVTITKTKNQRKINKKKKTSKKSVFKTWVS